MDSVSLSSQATLLPHSPACRHRAARAHELYGTLMIFCMAFSIYLLLAFMMTQSSYINTLSIFRHARDGEFGFVFEAVDDRLQPIMGKLVLWLVAYVTGLSGSIVLYVLPAAAGAALLTWLHRRMAARLSFFPRTVICFQLFMTPAALALFTTGSPSAIKVLLMTAAVTTLVALCKDQQPRRYLVFGTLLATLFVIEANRCVALALLLPPYLLCGMTRRTRAEWISHLGLVLIPLLLTLSALWYLDWLLQQYVTDISFALPPTLKGGGGDALFGFPVMVGVLPLLLTACWLAGRSVKDQSMHFWKIVCVTYVAILLTLAALYDRTVDTGVIAAYGFGIANAALANVRFQSAIRRFMLSACLSIGLIASWTIDHGTDSASGLWRTALGLSLTRVYDHVAELVPSPIGSSFAATVLPDDTERSVPDVHVLSRMSTRTSAEHDTGSVRNYFARYGVTQDVQMSK